MLCMSEAISAALRNALYLKFAECTMYICQLCQVALEKNIVRTALLELKKILNTDEKGREHCN